MGKGGGGMEKELKVLGCERVTGKRNDRIT